MTKSSPSTRAKSLPRLFLNVMAIAFVCAVLGALAAVFKPDAKPLIYAILGLVTGGVTLWMGWRWWVAVDEAVREAHKTSWYWGGSAGLVVVSMFALPLIAIAQGEGPVSGLTPSEAGFMLAGIVLTVFILLFGYIACWLGWWLSRSR